MRFPVVLRRWLLPALLAICLVAAAVEGFIEARETDYVGTIAHTVVEAARAATREQKALALRDYLRQHVSYQGLPQDNRPYFRYSAADVLRTGRGYCGDVSRAFICMADAVDLPAQRINLYGTDIHTVAEADIGQRRRVVLDCQNPPHIPDALPGPDGKRRLPTIDQVIALPQYDDYYTLNLRRIHVNWLVTRVKLENGPVNVWMERPHALKAFLWLFIAALVGGYALWRAALRRWLLRRGWIHISDRPRVERAVGAAESAAAARDASDRNALLSPDVARPRRSTLKRRESRDWPTRRR